MILDIFWQLGGEVLSIICPETDLPNAWAGAEKLRQKIEESSISTIGHKTMWSRQSALIVNCHYYTLINNFAN